LTGFQNLGEELERRGRKTKTNSSLLRKEKSRFKRPYVKLTEDDLRHVS